MMFQHPHYLYKNNWQRWHIDPPLLLGLFCLSGLGLVILYSASQLNDMMIVRQALRLLLAFSIMFIFAQIPPITYRHWTPWVFFASLLTLVAVLIMGKIGKGAQRWLDIGFIRFQPSEFIKLAVPMMVAWYLSTRTLPPKVKDCLVAAIIIGIPFLLIAKQPDLSTAVMIALAGGSVLLFAGIRWRVLFYIMVSVSASIPILWHFMREYQRDRVFTFLDPESDPLNAGYHIIQSKIALGSGGIFGKGWLHGTQSHLQFLPEHATDFIFAVCGEEFGLVGCLILLIVILFISLRGLAIAYHAQETYTRLLAGSISLSFFLSAFINIGMVTGIIPVAGLPLPLVSYGGTSMLSLLAGFGILMSIHCHRTLLSKNL